MNDLLQYWIWLSTRKFLSSEKQLKLFEHFGSIKELYLADEKALLSAMELRPRELRSLLDKDLGPADSILTRCDDKRVSVLTWQDAIYPERLKNITNPPLVLYYEGTFPALDEEVSIGVVGSRRASAYGLLHGKRLGYQLGKSHMIVVSGGARGVDTQALLGALTAGYPTIAVLGCGTDVVYPAENRILFDDVRHNGCLISEYPPGTPPLSEHFPVRNRIICGLCQGVLIVEAPKASGAMITARIALDEGRDVFTIPANLGTGTAEGNFELLKSGAILVENSDDVLKEYVGRFPGLNVAYQPERDAILLNERDKQPGSAGSAESPGKARRSGSLDEILQKVTSDEASILRLLMDGPLDADSLIDRSQIPAGQVSGTVTLLEIRGYIKRYPGHRFGLSEKLLSEDSHG